jgi:cell division protein FtsZ
MAISLHIPENIVLKPVITVFCVGGAGGNAANNMLSSDLQVKVVVANTDAQALAQSKADHKIQLGARVTRGLGAGANPDVGAAAAEETINEIAQHIDDSHMVFIAAGMGGGTGTGAAPVIARVAKERGILTIGVITKPFNFEGGHRMKLAESGIKELSKHVDTLIVIPNQNLFKIASESTTFSDAFKLADDVLYSGVRGITDLMLIPGLINLDFADIQTAMGEMGKAMMGSGEASGENRAIKAAEAAISNPLLEHSSMKGAKSVLINITGGKDMTLFEVDEAANRIREEIENEHANIIFGSTYNGDLDGKIRVSVVATGIETVDYTPNNFTPKTQVFFHHEETDEHADLEDTSEDSQDAFNIEIEPQKKSIGGFLTGIFKKIMSDDTARTSSKNAIIPEDLNETDTREYDEPTFTRKKEEEQS